MSVPTTQKSSSELKEPTLNQRRRVSGHSWNMPKSGENSCLDRRPKYSRATPPSSTPSSSANRTRSGRRRLSGASFCSDTSVSCTMWLRRTTSWKYSEPMSTKKGPPPRSRAMRTCDSPASASRWFCWWRTMFSTRRTFCLNATGTRFPCASKDWKRRGMLQISLPRLSVPPRASQGSRATTSGSATWSCAFEVKQCSSNSGGKWSTSAASWNVVPPRNRVQLKVDASSGVPSAFAVTRSTSCDAACECRLAL
mmetsp:Transcript_105205/g.297700  ORF Transcript_105205/g.297700 Transcript_105205/m.297700 type:complete len:253 (-) Transcript_105205:733-1491(-)